jgi:hypothetical protein
MGVTRPPLLPVTLDQILTTQIYSVSFLNGKDHKIQVAKLKYCVFLSLTFFLRIRF